MRRSAFDTACWDIARLDGPRSSLGRLEAAHLRAQYEVVADALPGLIAKAHKVPPNDAEELAQEALLRFVAAVRRGAVDPDGSPAGYLLVTALRLAADRTRALAGAERADLDQLPPERHAEDSAVDRLLEALAGEGEVRAGMAAAAARGDHMTLKVVAAWLDLAGARGGAPSSRDVASATGLSHTTVNNRLSRFAADIRSVR